jgi:hypothetical protein
MKKQNSGGVLIVGDFSILPSVTVEPCFKKYLHAWQKKDLLT